MLGSEVLDVAIGVIFVYSLVSLLCSAVREGLEGWFKTRAAYLEYAIRELLHDRSGLGTARAFFNHPLISGLYALDYQPGRSDRRPGLLARGRNLPSYIGAKNFAVALMDMAARGPDTGAAQANRAEPLLSLATLRVGVLALENASVRRALLLAIDSAQGDLDKARANIEAWYDSAMERVSGWYKRSTQWVLLWIGLFVAVAGNIDTIAIADHLYRNEGARAALVERAKVVSEDPKYLESSYETIKGDLEAMRLPIGWGPPLERIQKAIAKAEEKSLPVPDYSTEVRKFVLGSILGWLLTAFAATLGAPFWFDVLQKVMVVRATIKPPAPPPAPPPPTPDPSAGRSPRAAPPANPTTDVADDADGCEACGAGHTEETPDDQLPAARGGVA